jgi:hypothetical protein
METKTETKKADCAFLMRVRGKIVAVCETGDGTGDCVIFHCRADADSEDKGEKRTVSRLAAWIEITAMVGSAAANIALPGVVSA